MAPWNRATPSASTGEAYTQSPTRRPLRSAASRSNLSEQQTQPSIIRSVTPPATDDRPPSFHSQAHGAYQSGVYSSRGEEAYYAPEVEPEEERNPYDGYASPQRGPTPAQALYLHEADVGSTAYREVGLSAYDYAPRTEVDMDLHLDQHTSHSNYDRSAPHYEHQHNNERYDAEGEYYDEEDEKNDKFEDSFEGPVDQWEGEDDEKHALDDEEQGAQSPAISFAGGFGAPPPVSTPCCGFDGLGARDEGLTRTACGFADGPLEAQHAQSARQTHRWKPRPRLRDP